MECNGNVPDKALSSSAEDLSDYTDADESISAPTEILAEFLSAVMLKDYDSALKYCKMILQYEPNHATAKEFYPLILEKIIQASAEAEADVENQANADSEPESSESEDSDSEDDEEGGEEEEEEEEEKRTTDSDATTASYSSLEDEEADNVQSHTHSPTDDNAFVLATTTQNNNYSDSESPTEPVSQAARLRHLVVSGKL
ncbi:glutamate-rich protein 2 [Macrosteles quadrilineatus]|uniref:glutamate-rich protein 2 n=1 Tax=Macrosteles quadrilineatus TaxID=74068 RepID=UPI0023E1AEE0|nr:glutamate-rich protein 2 [Macrosteles quadrilineatus]